MADHHALVIDDHPTDQLLACALLKKMGWTVHEAESGETALAHTDHALPEDRPQF